MNIFSGMIASILVNICHIDRLSFIVKLIRPKNVVASMYAIENKTILLDKILVLTPPLNDQEI